MALKGRNTKIIRTQLDDDTWVDMKVLNGKDMRENARDGAENVTVDDDGNVVIPNDPMATYRAVASAIVGWNLEEEDSTDIIPFSTKELILQALDEMPSVITQAIFKEWNNINGRSPKQANTFQGNTPRSDLEKPTRTKSSPTV